MAALARMAPRTVSRLKSTFPLASWYPRQETVPITIKRTARQRMNIKVRSLNLWQKGSVWQHAQSDLKLSPILALQSSHYTPSSISVVCSLLVFFLKMLITHCRRHRSWMKRTVPIQLHGESSLFSGESLDYRQILHSWVSSGRIEVEEGAVGEGSGMWFRQGLKRGLAPEVVGKSYMDSSSISSSINKQIYLHAVKNPTERICYLSGSERYMIH